MLYVLNIASAYCLKSLVDRTDSSIDGQFLDVMGDYRSDELAEGLNYYAIIYLLLLDYACSPIIVRYNNSFFREINKSNAFFYKR